MNIHSPAFEIVGGKISNIFVGEISVWPLEPLSATPTRKLAEAPRAPLVPM